MLCLLVVLFYYAVYLEFVVWLVCVVRLLGGFDFGEFCVDYVSC